MTMCRIILYEWGSNTEGMLKKNLTELGHEVTVFACKCEHYTKDLKFAQKLINFIHESNAQSVISYDYFPIISMVCNTVGISYYSWVYDSPHYTLFSSISKYQCNRIGCFDRALVKRLNRLDIDTIFHLPLGVDWNSYTDSDLLHENGVTNEDRYNSSRYKCDISFVGSLYTGEFNYYDCLLDDEILMKKADEIIRNQIFEYKEDYIKDFFKNGQDNGTDIDISNRAKTIIYQNDLFPGDGYIEDVEYIFNSHFLEKKVTVEERRILLNEVAKRHYDFALYTGSDLSKEPKLKRLSRGIVDYHKEMPRVFANSRINLNITLRSIKTGIPLRALDIMGCGGFLLSNYQEEMTDYFEEGKEVVLFYGIDDCLEKIDYYLVHEDERKDVAAAGMKAVRERFSIKDKLKILLN